MGTLGLVLPILLIIGFGTGKEHQIMNHYTRQALDEVLRSAVAANEVPGAVAMVVDRNDVLYSHAAGVMDAEGTEAMQLDAIFRIFSMTKPITSLGIMILQEERQLFLDDPASKYLPELADLMVLVSVDADNSSVRTRPASRPITIRDLLCHTSGIGYTFTSRELLEVSQIISVPEREYPILHDPGTQWTYGRGTAFLGWIIEEVSGQSLSDFIVCHITDPLEMVDTSFDLAPEDHGRLVATYQRTDTGLEGQPQLDQYEPMIRGDYGLLSTASDYARFMQLVLNGGRIGATRVVSEASIAEMTRDNLKGITVVEQPSARPHLSKAFPLGAGKDGFGLGFQVSVGQSVGGRAPGSLSWAGIRNTHFWIDPSTGIGVLLLLQLLPFYDEYVIDLMTRFERALYDGLA